MAEALGEAVVVLTTTGERDDVHDVEIRSGAGAGGAGAGVAGEVTGAGDALAAMEGVAGEADAAGDGGRGLRPPSDRGARRCGMR